MRKLELIAVFATLAAATPVMAQGRGRGNHGEPPGQRIAAQHRRNNDGDRDDRDRGDDRDSRNRNINGQSGAIVLPNGQVVFPTGTRNSNGSIFSPNGSVFPNGQNCMRRTDRSGNARTVCRNQRRANDGDEDDRFENTNRGRGKHMKFKKAKKHDRDRDGDDDR